MSQGFVSPAHISRVFRRPRNCPHSPPRLQLSLSSTLLLPATLTVAYQSLFYVLAARLKTDRFTDFAATSNIAFLALIYIYQAGSLSVRHFVVPVAVAIWAVRLGAFLVRRIEKWGVDLRFEDIRASPLAFATFWALQAVWVFVIALPVIFLGLSKEVVPLSVTDVVAGVMFAAGLAVEMIADRQKGVQRESKPWPDEGLWRYSRHPNYFGEIILWWGIYLAAAPALHSWWRYLAALSPAVECVALLFISGVPILERRADERNGGKREYWAYKERTSLIVPLPPVLYESLPMAVKRWVLLDLPVFNQREDSGGDRESSE